MATHRIPILGAGTIPDATGNAFFEPYSIKATNDQWRHLVAVLNDSGTKVGLYGSFWVPKNYVGTPKIIVVWATTATTGNVVWDFDYRAIGGDDTESLDQSGTQEAVTVTDAAASAAHERLTPEMALTAANLAADDLVEFFFARDGASASDTLAAAALVHALIFEYADA